MREHRRQEGREVSPVDETNKERGCKPNGLQGGAAVSQDLLNTDLQTHDDDDVGEKERFRRRPA